MSHSTLFRNRWADGIFILSLLTIILLTLSPFNFSFEGKSLLEIYKHFEHSSTSDDWIANILLYTPFGFSLAACLHCRKVSKRAYFVYVLLLAFSLSITVEVLQVFLPSRLPSSTDIYANTLGGFIGLQCFNYLGQTIIFGIVLSIQNFVDRRITSLPIQHFFLISTGYLIVIFLASISLQSTITLNNWTPVYFLIVGNDQSINEPWHGSISNLSIADQSVSEEDVAQIFSGTSLADKMPNSTVASYSLTFYDNGYLDKTGHSPKLVWQGQTVLPKSEVASTVNSEQWLETEEPASLINQRVGQTSQFTLSTVLATTSTDQSEPASIVSFSNHSTDRRNLGFAQNGRDFVFWLRTSVTGEHGTKPEIIVPNFFTDTEFHHLIITYDRSILRFYIDEPEKQFSFEFNPGIVVFRKLLPLENLKNAGLTVCRFLYYGVFFAPLGIFVGTIVNLSRRSMDYRKVLPIVEVLFVPFGLEMLLAVTSGRAFNINSFLIGAVMMAMSITITIILSRPLPSMATNGGSAIR